MKFARFVLGIIIAGGVIWAGIFGWKNFRGLKPVITQPPSDIGELIESSTNNTDFPLKLPDGINISIFARDLGGPRVLVTDPNGIILTSIPSQNRIVALPDRDSNGKADALVTVADQLEEPHGLAFLCPKEGNCSLYVAETTHVVVFDYDPITLKTTNRRNIIDLPSGGHTTRSLFFLSDNQLLVSIGSSCNVCKEEDPRRAAIYVANADGSNFRPFATGLRNAVFMTLHPESGVVWATEMGRDQLGDDLPPDEVNSIEDGKNYGWPYCYGKNTHDSEVDKQDTHVCENGETEPSLIDIQAHSAPLGLTFVPEKGWRQALQGNLLVAYHGSWNRTEPTGYKVVRYEFDGAGNPQPAEDFITGWLTPENEALGRPVALLFDRNNALYISDDKAGVIYRVTDMHATQ